MQYSRIDEIKEVNDVVIVKDFNVANKERNFEDSEEKIFQRLFSDCKVLLRTGELKSFHQQTVEESPANHHEYENNQADVDQIKILKAI